MTVIGFDVSEYSGYIDFSQVRGARFGACRIGTGKYGADNDEEALDARARHNWSGLGQREPFTAAETIEHGMRRFGYYFPYIRERGDGDAQGRQFVRLLRRMPGEVRKHDGVIFDCEDQDGDECWKKLTPREREYEATAFMAAIEDHLDRRGIFYGGSYFMRELFGENYEPRVGSSVWHTMVSWYNEHPNWADVQTRFVELMLVWQHAGDGVGASPTRIQGIGSDIDVSRLMKGPHESNDFASFVRYGNARS